MRTRALLAATALAATLTACSGGGDAPDLECETVDQAALDRIASFAEASTGGITVARGAAYKSPNYGNVYFIAAEFTADGIGDEVGVWAANRLDGSGLIMAADNTAQEFTDFPDGNSTSAEIPTVSDDIDNAKDCLAQAS